MKIAVLTDPESAAGYRLGGLEVAVAPDPDQARELLARLVRQGDYALVVVSMTLLPDPHQAVKLEMRGRDLPILLSAPSRSRAAAGSGPEAEAYLRQLIRETMGYEIKLQKPDSGPRESARPEAVPGPPRKEE